MKCHQRNPKPSSRILLVPVNEHSTMSRLLPRAPEVLENQNLSSSELLCFHLHGAKEEQASSYMPLPTTCLLTDFIFQGLGKGSRLRDKDTFCSLLLGRGNGKGYNFSLLPARVLEKIFLGNPKENVHSYSCKEDQVNVGRTSERKSCQNEGWTCALEMRSDDLLCSLSAEHTLQKQHPLQTLSLFRRLKTFLEMLGEHTSPSRHQYQNHKMHLPC